MNDLQSKYQAMLLVSLGGPEGPDDVMPYLKNVLRGRNVPESRMLEVAKHYDQFGGVSPINEQNRALIESLKQEFTDHEIKLPIYFGNRNWNPLLEDTLRQMKEDGVKDAIAFFTSTFSCYSGCRQYRENIYEAQQNIGEGAPRIHKVRMSFNHPLFVKAASERVTDAAQALQISDDSPVELLFTAHSIPESMAGGCNYQLQLNEACRLVANESGLSNWKLAFQSRSGPPHQPWLEPDICDYLEQVKAKGVTNVIIMPIGFVSDHMEVMFDLDVEAQEKCEELGIRMSRAKTFGTHQDFVTLIRELVLERAFDTERLAVGELPASHDVCPPNCCQSGRPGHVSPV